MTSRPFRSWLVLVLLVANLAVGVLSLFFLRSVNQKYATLFEGSIPVVTRLRTLTRETTQVQRLARRIAEPDNVDVWFELLRELEEKKLQVWDHAQEISGVALFRGTDHATVLSAMGREYDGRIGEYIQLTKAGKLMEAGRFNNEVLRPTYDRYQLKLDAAAALVEAQGNNIRERYTKESRFFGGVLLAFAGWPVLAAVVAVAVLGLLIVTLFMTIFTPELGWNKRMPRSGR